MQDFKKMNLNQLRTYFSQIKLGCKETYTNFYTQENTSYEVKITPHSIIFLKKEKNFFRLYFFSNNLLKLKKDILNIKNNKNIFIEILQKEEKIKFNGLCKKATYIRLKKDYKNTHTQSRTSEEKIYSDTLEAKKVQKLIQRDFNPYFDHFPNLKSIQKHLNKDHILFISHDKQICSYIMFDIKGKVAYINYIANYGGKKNLIKIWQIFYEKLNNFLVESIYLWCDVNNTKAMNMYQIENFIPEGLKNFIYIKPPQKSKSISTKISDGGGGYKSLSLTSLCNLQKVA